jgi:predicted AAA+ superfamily ATPase
LEGLVAQHLRAWIAYRGSPDGRLYFWRTRSGVEVDFVVYGRGCFVALEVKNTDQVRDSDLTGLRSFREDYPDSSAIYLYRGRERIARHDILCVPCEEFLGRLVPKEGMDVMSSFMG